MKEKEEKKERKDVLIEAPTATADAEAPKPK